MLDKRKVRIMTRLALYEQNQGKEDFRISEYYRKDYAGLHAIFSFLWVTVGYILVLGLGFLVGMDQIMEHISAAFYCDHVWPGFDWIYIYSGIVCRNYQSYL